MIYLVVGTDFMARKHKIDALCTTLQTKRPNAHTIIIDSDSFSETEIDQYISSVGLFDDKSIIKLMGVLDNITHKKFIIKHIQKIQESENVFVFSEQSLTDTEIKRFREHAQGVDVYNTKTNPNNASLFDLIDLFLQKNKRALLVRYHEYIQSGTSVEEIMGIIMWQAKTLHLALSRTTEQTNLKPFVYNKCKKSPWNTQESSNLHHQLITAYHDSRRGETDISKRLEQIFLSL